ncbi:calcineurin-like phosphoesterase [Algibacter lectus]|uniref:Calcineurin-like phosphoesterase n=1 Tax=Algibacter lectus TaxID=221126 RepID=A0A090VLY5_9FLAO|nr:calcineurin-like phosphoesterase [Algibacter lectus]
METVIINKAKNFNSLFPLYEQEYAYLSEMDSSTIWNKDILTTENYKDFTKFHLKELVRLRFLPSDWPKKFADSFLTLRGKICY